MGLEASCDARIGGKVIAGKAWLEEKEIRFRGTVNLKIPFGEIRSAVGREGWLEVKWGKSVAAFELGAQSERWAFKIRHPRSLLDKLGVKPNDPVSILGINDANFLAELKGRTAAISHGKVQDRSAFVFVAVESTADLTRLGPLGRAIRENGAIWVVWRKGQKAIREDDIRACGPKVGLVDVKVVSFSETLSALKMVVPLALRKR